MSTAPTGWGTTEYAASQAREALARWDANLNPQLCLERGEALAETMRTLLAELEADRQARRS